MIKMEKIKKQTGYFKSFDKTSIYYEVRGEGPPLLFCYGIGCVTNHWHNQIDYFSQNHTTIMWDYRGHHQSDVPENKASMTVEAMAQDLHLLLDHLGYDTIPTALGHSFGGMVLFEAQKQNSNRLEKLIFINGYHKDPLKNMFGGRGPSKVFDTIQYFLQKFPSTTKHVWQLLNGNPALAIPMGLSGGFNLKLTQLKDIEIYLRGLKFIDLESFIVLFEDMRKYDATPILSKISKPTLVLSGKQDHVIATDIQEEMIRLLPHAESIWIPYGSHCSQLDMPDYVNLRIDKFLNSN